MGVKREGTGTSWQSQARHWNPGRFQSSHLQGALQKPGPFRQELSQGSSPGVRGPKTPYEGPGKRSHRRPSGRLRPTTRAGSWLCGEAASPASQAAPPQPEGSRHGILGSVVQPTMLPRGKIPTTKIESLTGDLRQEWVKRGWWGHPLPSSFQSEGHVEVSELSPSCHTGKVQ